jgi:predicted nucleic acid-binding protein
MNACGRLQKETRSRRVSFLFDSWPNDWHDRRGEKDDMILELAVASQCPYIVTYNKRHFRGAEQFGVRVITPQELLEKIGALP